MTHTPFKLLSLNGFLLGPMPWLKILCELNTNWQFVFRHVPVCGPVSSFISLEEKAYTLDRCGGGFGKRGKVLGSCLCPG